MKDDPKSYETQRRAADSTRDLGQNEAEAEQRSEEQLKHMGKSKAKKSSAPQGIKLGQKKAALEKASDKKLQQM